MFSKENSELKVLKKLYSKIGQRFWYWGNLKEVSDSSLYMNLEYLFDYYIKIVKELENKKLSKFKCFATYGEQEDKFYGTLMLEFIKKSLIFELLMGCWEVTVVCLVEVEKSTVLLKYFFLLVVALIILGGIIGGMYYIKKNLGCRTIKLLMIRFFFYNYGFEYYKAGKEKPIVASMDGIGLFEKNSELIKAIFNMVIFYKSLAENNINMQRVLLQIDKLYKYHEQRWMLDNDLFYVIEIYYSFLFYYNLNSKKQKKFLRELSKKKWIAKIKNKEVTDLIRSQLQYSEEKEGEKAIIVFDKFLVKLSETHNILSNPQN